MIKGMAIAGRTLGERRLMTPLPVRSILLPIPCGATVDCSRPVKMEGPI